MKFTVLIKSKLSEDSREVLGNRCILGSGTSAQIVLPGWKVQKEHAELFISNEQVYLRDLASMFGTLVDGKKVSTYGPMKSDSIIQIGGFEVSVQWSRQSTSNASEIPPIVPTTSHEELGIKKRIDELIGAGSQREGDHEKNTALKSASLGEVNSANIPIALADERRRIPPEGRVFASPNSVDHANPGRSTEAGAIFVQQGPSKDDHTYKPVMVDEARLTLRRSLQEKLIASFDLRRIDIHKMTDIKLREQAESALRLILKSENLDPQIDQEELIAEVRDEAIGLGLLEPLLADPSVTEIMVNNFDEIFVERNGVLTRMPLAFSSANSVMGIIERIVAPVGRRIDESSPLVDARLKDGSRFNAIIPPLALKGPSMTIRKFATKKLNGDDLIRFNSASVNMVKFLEIAVLHKKNIIVSGGTGSGKTTLLNILSNFIPNNERIVTIEDAAELRLHHEHLVSLEARPANAEGKGAVPIRDLVKNSLRMRPDRIVVGECRGGEALDMLQAMNTGHDGSLTTAHANTPRDMLARLEVMVLMSGMDLPITAIREQVVSAVNIVVQQTRFACGTRKITKIAEVTGIESGRIQLQELFEFVETGFTQDRKVDGYFTGCGSVPEFYEQMQASGLNLDIRIFEKAK
jgi:pilus assembly protein CpaF